MRNGTWTNSEGWTFDYHDRDTDLFNIPSETIRESKDLKLQLVHIAHSKGMTRRVYFLDRLDRNAWVTIGQYKTAIEGLEQFNKNTQDFKVSVEIKESETSNE